MNQSTLNLRVVWLLALGVTGASNSISLAADQNPPNRVLAGDYEKKRLGLVDVNTGQLAWEIPIRDIHDLWVLPNGNILTQTNWTFVAEFDSQQRIVWSYDASKMNGNAGKPVEVHSFQRLPSGLTMIAESGPGRIIEVDKSGKIKNQIKLKVSKPDPHRDTRLVRKLDNGHYLVCHEGDAAVREYDSLGAITWEYAVKSASGTPVAVYSANRLRNGHTLIGCGNGHRVIEVDLDGKTVWSVEEKDLPGIQLTWVTMTERLPNGNTFIVNCHAGPNQPQLLEVTPDKKVAWAYRDFSNFGNALPAARAWFAR
jgi:hypothetical protein